jgi:transmembrane protein EpsG
MLVYILAGFLIVVMNILFYKKSKYSFFGNIIALSILFLLSVFRDISVGTDYQYYENMFRVIGEHSFSDWKSQLILVKKEFGWYYMNKIFYNSGTFFLYSLCFYSIMYFFIFKTILEKSSIPLLSILLYFFCGYYFASMNIMRQAFVFSFFFYSIRFIIQGKFWKYTLVLLLSSLFHMSALILIPLYFIREFKWSKLFLTIILIISLIMGYTNLFIKITPYIHIERLNSYINSLHNEISFSGYLFFALNSILSLVFIYFTQDIKSKDNIYLKLTVFGLILSNLVMHFQWLFRFSDGYLVPLMIIGYVKVISECKLYNNRVVLISALLIYALLMFYLNLSHNSNSILPYKLVF